MLALIVGVALIVGAALLRRETADELVRILAIVLFIAGLVLVAVGLVEIVDASDTDVDSDMLLPLLVPWRRLRKS